MDGKVVICLADPEVPHTVDRTLCILGARNECPGCPNRFFTIRFQLHATKRAVSCPRWVSEADRQQEKEPVAYLPVQRDFCLNKPFLQCTGCPNSNISEKPRTQPRWWELEKRARRIELELDEEARDG